MTTTVRLLSTYDGFKPQDIIDLPDATATALIGQNGASTNLTGGTRAYRAISAQSNGVVTRPVGTRRVNPNRRLTVEVPEGFTMRTSGTSDAVGAAQRVDASGAAIGSAVVLGAGVGPNFGTYAGGATYQVSCTAGGIDVEVGDVATASAQSTSDALGNTYNLQIQGAGFALPQSDTPVCAIFGDSITDQNTYNTTTKAFRAIGYFTWLRFLSMGLFDMPVSMNYGVPGDTTTMMRARVDTFLAAAKAAGINTLFFMAGTNDAQTGVSYATSVANYTALFGKFRAAGLRVFVESIPPRAGLNLDTDVSLATRRQYCLTNQWLDNYCRANPGFHFVNATAGLVDFAATGNAIGDPIGGKGPATGPTAVTYDGTHFQRLGAYWQGKRSLDVAAPFYAPAKPRFVSPADIADTGGTNPYGNLLTNGILNGTAGTLAGGAGGQAADSWTLQASSGGALVQGSKGSVDAGNGNLVPAQVMTLGPGACSGRIYQQKFATGLGTQGVVVGDTVYAECMCSVTGAVAMTELVLHIDDGTNTAEDMSGTSQGYMPAAFSGLLRSPPMVLSSLTAVTARVTATVTTASGAAAITLSNFVLRKVLP